MQCISTIINLYRSFDIDSKYYIVKALCFKNVHPRTHKAITQNELHLFTLCGPESVVKGDTEINRSRARILFQLSREYPWGVAL